MEGKLKNRVKHGSFEKDFCFFGGNTSMGGSCINTEVEHLDVYRRGWQGLSLAETMSPAERGFLERFSITV